MGGIGRPLGDRPNWFIALVVPPRQEWSDPLDHLPPGLHPFAAEDRHLTIAFLGACGEERAQQAWDALASLRCGPIQARPASWRAMGPRRRPSAYALTLSEGEPEVADLMRRWGRRACRCAGLSPDDREPLPHITVARAPRRLAEVLRAPMRQWMECTPIPGDSFPLERIALYGWNPDRSERLFRIVNHRRLDAPESSDPLSPPLLNRPDGR